MVYSPGRERVEKFIPQRKNQYCYKCKFNTDNAFLDNCDNCNTDSFTGCGHKIEWMDDENMPTGESTFLCCYCKSLQKDIAYSLDIDSDKMKLTSEIVAEWASKHGIPISSARRQYEAKIANNGRTVNQYSERLYGYYNDDSTQLAVCIYNNHWFLKESKEHVCPECDRTYKDVIDLTTEYNPICIECAAESYYNSRGHRLYPDVITIFNNHRYDAGFYPDCKNYVDVAYCHTLKDGSGYPAITMLFYKYSGDSNYKLKMVTIE